MSSELKNKREISTSRTVLFISHSNKDIKSVRAIVDMIEKNFQLVAEAIEEYNITDIKFNSKTITEMIRATCLPGHGLQAGDHIAMAIRGHLKDAKSIIIFITDNSLRSTYVTSELGGGWALKKKIKMVYGPNLFRGTLGPPLSEFHSIQWNDPDGWFQLIQGIIEELIEEIDKSGMIEHNLVEHNFRHSVYRAMDKKYDDIRQNIEYTIKELEPSVFWHIWNNIHRLIYPIKIPLMVIIIVLLAVCSTYLYLLMDKNINLENKIKNLDDKLSMEPIQITMECGKLDSSSNIDSYVACRKIVEEWQEGFNQTNDRKVSIAVLPTELPTALIRREDEFPDPEKPSSIQEGVETLGRHLSEKSKVYDIIQFDVLWASSIAKAESLQELEMEDKDQDDHFPSMIESGKHEGILKAVPWSVDIGVLYYNKNLLDELMRMEKYTTFSAANLNNLSWNDLRDLIKTAENYGWVGFIWQSSKRETLTCTALEWISSFGENSPGESEWITKEQDRELLDFSNQKVIKALTEAALLMYGIPSVFKSHNLLDLDNDRSIDQFGDKKTLFMRHWLSQYALIQNKYPGDWFNVIPLPKNDNSGKRVGVWEDS